MDDIKKHNFYDCCRHYHPSYRTVGISRFPPSLPGGLKVNSSVRYSAAILAMSKGKQIDIGKKVKVMACHREGLAPKEIANRLKRDISTIRKIISATKHLPVSATLPAVKKRSGRLKMNTARQKERFSRYLLCYPLKTAKEIKQEVAGWSNITMRTIQMVCQKSPGLPSRSAAKKPQLTTEMIKKRQNFCKKHCSWTEKSVVLSDKSAFRLINPRAMKVRQPSTTKRYKQRYTEVNVKHLASVMV
jgi:hypothetical protein